MKDKQYVNIGKRESVQQSNVTVKQRNKKNQNKIKQNKTEQNKTKQNKTKQMI